GSCGGTLVGTGNPLTIPAPAVPTTYFARWTTPSCGVSACPPGATVTPLARPVAPTGVTAVPSMPCVGDNVVLTANGGSGENVQWFSGSCGGTLVGTGNPLTIPAPAVPTTYFARWTTTSCGVSACPPGATVTPVLAPRRPTDIGVVPETPCAGARMSLFVSGGSGGTVEWFIGTCTGAPVATGNPWNTTAPSVPTTYLAR